jgi:hypothetical protein
MQPSAECGREKGLFQETLKQLPVMLEKELLVKTVSPTPWFPGELTGSQAVLATLRAGLWVPPLCGSWVTLARVTRTREGQCLKNGGSPAMESLTPHGDLRTEGHNGCHLCQVICPSQGAAVQHSRGVSPSLEPQPECSDSNPLGSLVGPSL